VERKRNGRKICGRVRRGQEEQEIGTGQSNRKEEDICGINKIKSGQGSSGQEEESTTGQEWSG
jgi:hypothetical protein